MDHDQPRHACGLANAATLLYNACCGGRFVADDLSAQMLFFFFNLKNLISLVDLISIQDGRNREYPISCVVERQAFHRE